MTWKGWKPAPLPASFMLTAIIGFLVSALWVYPQNITWGLTFLIFFTLMFIASLLSMTKAPAQVEWALDQRKKRQ